ncbi:hypothetical protein WR25_08335 isoform B [Diploscapter pachys]|uniref:Uncharacterized protein n=1 Tax=Diploscapter pachys TaxID=2018661 RepID=A0A2A2JTL9_9BILA|nr:hypothetical protein WR25_08335 isoform B [Diploscapter pachys]
MVYEMTNKEEPQVRMRGEKPPNGNPNASAHAALARGLEALNEGELGEETEEFRKLDSQIDLLNNYMTKMEEKLKVHNDKIMETLKQQKEEREKRRRSFHERMTQNQSEDNEFRKQMENIMKRVDSVRKRQSTAEVPPLNGHA